VTMALRWATSITLVLSSFVSIQSAQAQTKEFNVPAQSATTGIPEFARQAGIQILVSEPLVRGKRIAAVTGSHTIDEALAIILKGTGLAAASKDGTTYTLAAARPSTFLNSNGSSSALAASETPSNRITTEPAPAMSAENPKATAGLTEIIVTAQKRSERLQDVPVPVTALSADALVANNQLRLQDYYTSVPGLSFTPSFGGSAYLSIRGITTGAFTNPTVGITIDGVPYGSSSALSNAEINVPDLDPGDLQRVEILRGPQGTLYGASSLGGLLQYVTTDPSTDAVSGRIQAGTESVQNGAELGYNLRGSVNVPLSDTLAVRVSGFTRRDPGYIDDPTLGIEGVNKTDVDGGHVALLWRPSSEFSLKVGALVQHTSGNGSSFANVNPGLGTLQQNFIPGTGQFDLLAQLYTVNLSAKLAGLDFTSVTGYGNNRVTQLYDSTFLFGGAFGIPTAAGAGLYTTRKFSQEFRVGSSVGPIDWLVGAFYTHEDSPTNQQFTAAPGAVLVSDRLQGPLIFEENFPSTFAEYAGFADVTYHFTNRFDVQIGGRESTNRQVYNETDSGLGYTPPLVNPTIHTKDSAFTFLVTPQFKFTDDLMAYVRVASGYRPGGPNPEALLYGYPDHYGADRTVNYELGLKGDLADHKVNFDASVYYINWQDIQIQVIEAYSVFYTNGGSAKSQGIELSGDVRPVDGLKLAGWVAFNDATLTANLPADSYSVALSGDRLPYSSRFSANASIDEEFPITAKFQGFVGATVNYLGQRFGEFPTPGGPPRAEYPGYAQANLHAGVRDDSWNINLFLNNIANKRGVTYIDVPQHQGYEYIQPRTVGLMISKSF